MLTRISPANEHFPERSRFTSNTLKTYITRPALRLIRPLTENTGDTIPGSAQPVPALNRKSSLVDRAALLVLLLNTCLHLGRSPTHHLLHGQRVVAPGCSAWRSLHRRIFPPEVAFVAVLRVSLPPLVAGTRPCSQSATRAITTGCLWIHISRLGSLSSVLVILPLARTLGRQTVCPADHWQWPLP